MFFSKFIGIVYYLRPICPSGKLVLIISTLKAKNSESDLSFFLLIQNRNVFYIHIWYNNTSWMTVVISTERPKSVRNRRVIEAFGGVFVLSICFRIFCWYRGFCYRTRSDLLVFLFIVIDEIHLLLWIMTGLLKMVVKCGHIAKSFTFSNGDKGVGCVKFTFI